MSFQLPSGLTVQSLIADLAAVADAGLSALEMAELVPLVQAAARIAEDGAALLTSAGPAEVLQTEIDTEQAAGDVAEHEKFPNG